MNINVVGKKDHTGITEKEVREKVKISAVRALNLENLAQERVKE